MAFPDEKDLLANREAKIRARGVEEQFRQRCLAAETVDELAGIAIEAVASKFGQGVYHPGVNLHVSKEYMRQYGVVHYLTDVFAQQAVARKALHAALWALVDPNKVEALYISCEPNMFIVKFAMNPDIFE